MKELKWIAFLTLLTAIPLIPLSGQTDTLKNNEIRLSFVGKQVFTVWKPGLVQEDLDFLNDPTITYLRRIPAYPRIFFKTDLSFGFRKVSDFDFNSDQFIASGDLRYLMLNFGIERQVKFRYFGLFISGGVQSAYVDYQSDFTPINRDPISNYKEEIRYAGLIGQATFYFQVAKKLYLFSTTTISSGLASYRTENNGTCCEQALGSEYMFSFLDALGLAYKF